MSPARAFILTSWLLSASACAGPPSPSTLKDEPVCPDFVLGPTHTKMRGSLRQPLLVKVKDGSRIVATVHVNGLSSSLGHPSLFLLPDANAEYAVEFYQCPNERAPTELTAVTDEKERASTGQPGYKCGEKDGHPYATSKLVTKKGSDSSRTVAVTAPDDATCWSSDTSTDSPSSSP